MDSDVIHAEIDHTVDRIDQRLHLLAARARSAEQTWEKALSIAVSAAAVVTVVVGAVAVVAAGYRLARLLKVRNQRRCT